MDFFRRNFKQSTAAGEGKPSFAGAARIEKQRLGQGDEAGLVAMAEYGHACRLAEVFQKFLAALGQSLALEGCPGPLQKLRLMTWQNVLQFDLHARPF